LARLMRSQLRRDGEKALLVPSDVALHKCDDMAAGCHGSITGLESIEANLRRRGVSRIGKTAGRRTCFACVASQTHLRRRTGPGWTALVRETSTAAGGGYARIVCRRHRGK
jgi:hypothetical protein